MTPQEIKELRQSLNLSLETFSRKIGVSSRSIDRWERGQAKPLPVFMAKLEALREELKKLR